MIRLVSCSQETLGERHWTDETSQKMPSFASFYRPRTNRPDHVARSRDKQSLKRKRSHESDSHDDEANDHNHDAKPSPTRDQHFSSDSPSPPPPTIKVETSLPVNRLDPYHVAGHSRGEPLPPPPFPHSAVKELAPPRLSTEDELARLNPPLFIPPARECDVSSSLRRRHLDNLTTILHRCMLNNDWPRAAKAWSLLIRTEVNGRMANIGIDLRRNAHWTIGAELLMRTGSHPRSASTEDADDDKTAGFDDDDDDSFSTAGFALARQYYERLILQFPHTHRSQRSFNALTVYPALFNVWIFAVQRSAQRARSRIDQNDADKSSTADLHRRRQLERVLRQELHDASAVADRLDDLLLGPPYDTDPGLQQLAGMIGLWTSNLRRELAESLALEMDEDVSTSMSEIVRPEDRGEEEQTLHARAVIDRQKARETFQKLSKTGTELPAQVMSFLHADEEDEQ